MVAENRQTCIAKSKIVVGVRGIPRLLQSYSGSLQLNVNKFADARHYHMHLLRGISSQF